MEMFCKRDTMDILKIKIAVYRSSTSRNRTAWASQKANRSIMRTSTAALQSIIKILTKTEFWRIGSSTGSCTIIQSHINKKQNIGHIQKAIRLSKRHSKKTEQSWILEFWKTVSPPQKD